MATVAGTGVRRAAGTSGVLPMPTGVGIVLGAATVLVSATVGTMLDGESQSGRLLGQFALGAAALIVGAGLIRLQKQDRHITASMAMSMVVFGWLGLTVVGVLGLWFAGSVGGFGPAAFEAVSATTTTGLTTVAEPEALPHFVQFQRVLLQWAAGLGVLAVAMGVLPVAVAGAELVTARPLRGRKQLVTNARSGLGKILLLYLLLTCSLFVGYSLFGMNGFDAASYSLSTASTGGMANHAASIGAFDSAGIELVATLGMMAAGANLTIVWWAFRGAWGSVWRSTELRMYAVLLGISVPAVWLFGDGLGFGDSAFALASMSSTTGLRSANWAAAGPFVAMVLLTAAGIGAMAGSVGSGFRGARTARIALEVRRGLRRLVKPHRVGVIRIDGQAVDEASLDRTFGYLWMHLFTLAGLAVMINATDIDVVGKLTITLTMVSNVGVFIDGDSISAVVDLGGWSETVGGFAMVLGRLSIYPVLITITGLWRFLRRLPREVGRG